GVAEATLVGPLVGDKADELGRFLLQTFEGLHSMPVGPRGEHRAAEHRLAVQQHGAQPAVGGLTPALDAGAAVGADKIEQQQVGRDFVGQAPAVQGQGYLHSGSPSSSSAQRRVKTSTRWVRYSAEPRAFA